MQIIKGFFDYDMGSPGRGDGSKEAHVKKDPHSGNYVVLDYEGIPLKEFTNPLDAVSFRDNLNERLKKMARMGAFKDRVPGTIHSIIQSLANKIAGVMSSVLVGKVIEPHAENMVRNHGKWFGLGSAEDQDRREEERIEREARMKGRRRRPSMDDTDLPWMFGM